MARFHDARWSTRVLLLVILCLSGCSRDIGHADESTTVALIQKVGGKVEYDGDGADRRVVKVYLHSTSVQDADLATLIKLPKLKNLFLGKTQVTDAGLEHLSTITELQTLSLNSTQITDAGLKRLSQLTKLKTLNLQETKSTPGGVAQLRKSLPKTTIAR